jgi:hypothetical protein
MDEQEARNLAAELAGRSGVSDVWPVRLTTLLTPTKPWHGFGVRWRLVLPATGLDVAGARSAAGSGDRLTFRPFAANPETAVYLANGFALGVVDTDETRGTVTAMVRIPHSIDPPSRAYVLRVEHLQDGDFRPFVWERGLICRPPSQAPE